MILAVATALVRAALFFLGVELVKKGTRARMYIAKGTLLRYWMRNISAVTLARCIVFTTPMDFANTFVRRHEMVHIAQIERDGILRFWLHYLQQYAAARGKGLDHSTAYYAIDYEADAYSKQTDPTLTFDP